MRNFCLMAAGLTASLWAIACTKSDLRCITGSCDPQAKVNTLDNVVAVSGKACVSDPKQEIFPYRILFIIDVSGSMVNSDAANNRSAALRAAITQYSRPGVAFGLIKFSTESAKVLDFTTDTAALMAASTAFDAANGFTNYVSALNLGQQMIQADAATLSVSDLARTQYQIQFLSDGQPAVSGMCQTYDEVNVAATSLMQLGTKIAFAGMRIDTVLLGCKVGNDGAATDCSLDPSCAGRSAVTYLQSVADIGGGNMQVLTSTELKFSIFLQPVLLPFQKQGFMLINNNRVLREDVLMADSDGDGIDDTSEVAGGTNPLLSVSDPNGCGDLTTYRTSYNKGLCAMRCSPASNTSNAATSRNDPDLDTLLNCEELTLGTGLSTPDTDLDGLLDPVEVRFNTNPGNARTPIEDDDGDGVNNAQEILTGTDPSFPEPSRQNAYIYKSFEPTASPKDGVSCFNFRVENVRLVQTQATALHPAGDNELCLTILQTLQQNSSDQPTVTRACKTANFLVDAEGNGHKTPISGEISVDAADFVTISCPGGC